MLLPHGAGSLASDCYFGIFLIWFFGRFFVLFLSFSLSLWLDFVVVLFIFLSGLFKAWKAPKAGEGDDLELK